LEQQCWRYLITALDSSSNAEYLHDLADRYDCPPLKLAAWKILKEKIPGIDSFPGTPGKKGKKGKGNEGNSMFVESSKKNFSSTGLTGPADPLFRAARALHAGGTRFGKLLDPEANIVDRANMPSVFDDGSDEEDHDDDEDDEEKDEEDEEEEDESRKIKVKRLEELDDKATATEVIKAWSLRLKEVYAQCSAVEDNESNHSDEENELALQDDTPNVKLKRSPRKQQRNSQIADRSDLLGEKDDHSIGSPNSNKKKKAVTPPVKPSLDHLKHYKSASAIQWDEVLSNFYLTMNMPNKVNGIPTILKTWSGKEEEMLHSLIEKYEKEGKDIPKKLNKYFQHIFTLLETQTDSSFRKSPKQNQKKRIEL
jgi:hypothetical protein